MPERWFVLSVRSPEVESTAALAEGLLALGGSAVEESEGELRTWIAPPPDPERFAREASAALTRVAAAPIEVSWCWHEERDWLAEWRRGLGPRRIGHRIVVTPTWIEPETREGDVVIAIDPQMAFGTGEHATTRIVLRLMETRVRAGCRVLDVGTGSAILAIAAAGLGAGEVDAIEADAEALSNAADNIERNHAAAVVRLQQGLVDENWLDSRPRGYALIVANVLSGVLRPMLPSFRRALEPGGTVVLCGILREEAETVRADSRAAGLSLAAEEFEDEWWGGALQRPASDVPSARA